MRAFRHTKSAHRKPSRHWAVWIATPLVVAAAAAAAVLTIGVKQAGSTPAAQPPAHPAAVQPQGAAARGTIVQPLSDSDNDTHGALYGSATSPFGFNSDFTAQYGDPIYVTMRISCSTHPCPNSTPPQGKAHLYLSGPGVPTPGITIAQDVPLDGPCMFAGGDDRFSSCTSGIAFSSRRDLQPSADKYHLYSSYQPNGPYNASGAQGPDFTVVPRDTHGAWRISVTPLSAAPGEASHLVAEYTGIRGGTPPGSTVEFKEVGGGSAGTATVQADGKATLDFNAPANLGDHTYTADYSGDTNYTAGNSSNQATQTVVAPKATSTTLTSSANPADVDQDITLTAKVAATDDPSARIDVGQIEVKTTAGVMVGRGTLTNGTLTLNPIRGDLALGKTDLIAHYTPKDGSFAESQSTVLTQVINAASTTTLTVDHASAQAGQPVTFTATVAATGGTPTGPVTFTVDGTPGDPVAAGPDGTYALTTSSLAVGTHTVVASYAGDDKYRASTASVTASTVVIPATITLHVDRATAQVGTQVTLTAAVDAEQLAPNQKVTFTVDGHSGGTGTLNGKGEATWSTASLKVGPHHVVASYPGDADHAAATSDAVSVRIDAAPVNGGGPGSGSGSGSGSGGGATPDNGGATPQPKPGSLASTGSNASGMTTLALVLLGSGLALTSLSLLGRKRRARR